MSETFDQRLDRIKARASTALPVFTDDVLWLVDEARRTNGLYNDALAEAAAAWTALGGDLTGTLPEAIGQLHKILVSTREQRDRALGLIGRSIALIGRLEKREGYHVQGRTLREWADLVEKLEAAVEEDKFRCVYCGPDGECEFKSAHDRDKQLAYLIETKGPDE